MTCLRFILIAISVTTSFSAVANAEPYCGIYAVYSAARSLNMDVSLDSLINVNYVTTVSGSSTKDLVRAAEACGLVATPLSMLGVQSLRRAESPIILHCSPRGMRGSFNHWMLFLGIDEAGFARIIDGGGGIVHCALEEVLSRWDGHAVAVQTPGRYTSFLSAELARALLVVCVAIVACLGLSRICFNGNPSWGVQILVGVVLAIVAGHSGISSGYRHALKATDIATGKVAVRRLSIDDALDLRSRASVAFVDCRYPSDFALGHIETAINVPVDVGLGTLSKIIKTIPSDCQVIVYCQSAECEFSQHSAGMLASMGLGNIAILDAGYNGWVRDDSQ